MHSTSRCTDVFRFGTTRQEDSFLSGVVRSMGSHLSHERAKELQMLEVPDMATVPGAWGVGVGW